jgi:glycosyltransferase involved in cell wall biosynthesis
VAAALADAFPEAAELSERLLARKYIRLALQLADAAGRAGVRRFHAHFASRAAHVAMFASRLLGVPYSFTAHAKDIYHRDVDRAVLRVKMRAAEFVVTVSDFNRDTLLGVGAGLPDIERKIVRLYNGVDLSLFHQAAPEEKIANYVLAVGRLVEKKGFPVLVRACDQLRRRGVPFSAAIVGAGQEEGRLRELIGSVHLEGTVHLRGALPAEEVANQIRRAAVVVLPCVVGSDGNVDALPTVLLEAMASGVPVVSTDLSGIPEIIANRTTGYLVPPGDPDALADAIQRVLKDPASAVQLGAAGRLRAAQLFDLRKNVAQLRGWLTGSAVAPETIP